MTSRTPVRLDPATGKKIPPPVSPKPVRMTATRLTKASARPPPPPPQPSGGMKSTEEELDALTDLLVKNLENTGDPDFFGKALRYVALLTVTYCSCVHHYMCRERLLGVDFCNPVLGIARFLGKAVYNT